MKNISFIIPNYNGELTIGKTIESILNQNYKGKIEIIIIDDESKDNSLKVISKYKNKVKLIKNKKNKGVTYSLNKGIKTSKYEIIAFLMCDCLLGSKDWLKKMVNILNSNKKIAAVGSKLVLPKNIWKEYSFLDKAIFAREYYLNVNNKIKKGKPALFKKKVLNEVGLYDSKTYRIAGEDTDMRLKILKKGYKIANAPTKILHLHVYYRLTLKQHLLNKALPMGEAIGVNFRRYGFKSLGNKYWNPFTSTFLYLGFFIPHIRWLSLIFLIILVSLVIRFILEYTRDIRIIFLPIFKVIKDITTIVGFWKGFITKKQNF